MKSTANNTRCPMKNRRSTLFSVFLLLSFICPYIINYCRLIGVRGYQPISDMFEHWPAYTVGICFFIMTIVVELPIVYYGLNKRTDNTKKLKGIIVKPEPTYLGDFIDIHGDGNVTND